MRTEFQFLLTIAALVIAAMLFIEWRAERHDRVQLQATLAAAEQSLQRASASQQERDKQLSDTIAKMESLKATVRTQQQILSRLPEVLPLPTPLGATPDNDPSAHAGPASSSVVPAKPDSPTPRTSDPPTTIPPEDLKPLYDFAVDCRTCQAKLVAATADLADEKSKTQTLSRERDAALKLAKGGSLRQRFNRALKWFAIGAAVGIVAAKH